MTKVLVSYFSASGITKKVAEKIADAINGDLFEIKPVEIYTTEDLDWTNKQSRSTIEMSNKSFRPQILEKVSNIEEYSDIIIGFPVWWYTAPTIINTFIEENNLDNKDVYVFVTSGGSGSDGSFNDLKNMYSNIHFVSSRRFRGNESYEEYSNWLKK